MGSSSRPRDHFSIPSVLCLIARAYRTLRWPLRALEKPLLAVVQRKGSFSSHNSANLLVQTGRGPAEVCVSLLFALSSSESSGVSGVPGNSSVSDRSGNSSVCSIDLAVRRGCRRRAPLRRKLRRTPLRQGRQGYQPFAWMVTWTGRDGT